MSEPVSLAQMLDAREKRVFRQQQILKQYNVPVISFTMNIAGPVKNSPLILRGFEEGQRMLKEQFLAAKIKPLFEETVCADTGNEAFYAIDRPALEIKRLTAAIEDGVPVGRLFDMDIIKTDGSKVDRSEIGLPDRKCIICGRRAAECARNRAHSVEELQKKTNEILKKHLEENYSRRIAELASRSILYEVCTTPKPGLVDCADNGSHKDMDIFTFMSSASALWPYFQDACLIGMRTADQDPDKTFSELRRRGRLAEGSMLSATGGVNTHKGAVFSVGLCCAALGRLYAAQHLDTAMILDECAAMTRGLTGSDYKDLTEENAKTAGEILFVKHKIAGVRGEAEKGFPIVKNVGFPVLMNGLSSGLSLNEAGCAALLAVIAEGVDTNVIARGGLEIQKQISAEIAELLKKDPYPERSVLEDLNRRFVNLNLSPGGSADIIAMCYFLYFLQSEAD